MEEAEEEDFSPPGAEEGNPVPGTGFRQAVNSPRHIKTARANAEAWNLFIALLILFDGYFRQTKNLPPQSMGTKGKPSAVPPAFAPTARTQASGNGGETVPLSGAAPGRTKGFPLRWAFSQRPVLSARVNSLFSRSTHFPWPPKAALSVFIPQIILYCKRKRGIIPAK